MAVRGATICWWAPMGSTPGARHAVRRALSPRFTGQGVWRYNFSATAGGGPSDVLYGRGCNCGLVPLADDLMYLFITSHEADSPATPRDQLAAEMRRRLPPGAGCQAACTSISLTTTRSSISRWKSCCSSTILVSGTHRAGGRRGSRYHSASRSGAGMAMRMPSCCAKRYSRPTTSRPRWRTLTPAAGRCQQIWAASRCRWARANPPRSPFLTASGRWAI